MTSREAVNMAIIELVRVTIGLNLSCCNAELTNTRTAIITTIIVIKVLISYLISGMQSVVTTYNTMGR